MGIMTPLTFNSGRQRALEDNRADQKYEQDQKYNDARMRGLELGMRRDQMALDEAEQDAPIRKMEREAKKISQIAQFGAANLSRVPDEKLNDYMAQLLSDMPVFGAVEVVDGKLFDGEKSMPMTRQSAMELLQGFSDPATAMKLKMEEAAYVNEEGKVETMSRSEAKDRGLGLATDQVAGYQLNEARLKDQYAPEIAALTLGEKKAQIAAHSRANQEKPQEVAFVLPDNTVRTMEKGKGLELGYTPLNDYKATQEIQGGGGEPYDFSQQNPDAIREGVIESAMMEKGYVYEEVMDPASGFYKKRWATQDGKPVPEAERKDALALANETLGLLSSGRAKDPVDAISKAKTRRATPPVQGAKKAPDGKWYVQTGTKPDGKPIWSPVLTD